MENAGIKLKRKRKPHKYKKITKLKVEGLDHQHRNKNKIIPAKTIGPDCRYKFTNKMIIRFHHFDFQIRTY